MDYFENSLLRKYINEELKKSGITKQKLSDYISLSRQSISKYLSKNSENKIPDSLIENIENILNLEKGYFYRKVENAIIEEQAKNHEETESLLYENVSDEERLNSQESENYDTKQFGFMLNRNINKMRMEGIRQALDYKRSIVNLVTASVDKYLVDHNFEVVIDSHGDTYANSKKLIYQFEFDAPKRFTDSVENQMIEKHDYIIRDFNSNEIKVISHIINNKLCIYLITDRNLLSKDKITAVETIYDKLFTLDGRSLEMYRII